MCNTELMKHFETSQNQSCFHFCQLLFSGAATATEIDLKKNLCLKRWVSITAMFSISLNPNRDPRPTAVARPFAFESSKTGEGRGQSGEPKASFGSVLRAAVQQLFPTSETVCVTGCLSQHPAGCNIERMRRCSLGSREQLCVLCDTFSPLCFTKWIIFNDVFSELSIQKAVSESEHVVVCLAIF